MAIVAYYEAYQCFWDGMVSVVGSEEVRVEDQESAEVDKAVLGNASGEAFAVYLSPSEHLLSASDGEGARVGRPQESVGGCAEALRWIACDQARLVDRKC